MDKKYISFSKLLSRRILMISIATFAVIALLVTAFANDIQQKMTDAYFQNGLFAAHESIGKRIGKVDADSLYRHIKMIDKGFNEFNPLFININTKDDKDLWAYNIVIDSVGTYIYHPDRQLIGKRNFYDDIRQTPADIRQALARGLTSGVMERQKINIGGVTSYIFYLGQNDTSWQNAVIVSRSGMLIPHIITCLILLTIIVLGLLAVYRVSRITIHRATIPLRVLTKSADEVAKGNFQAPLPELKQNNEISVLRDSFGNMQHSLTAYIEELKKTTAEKAAFESELSIAREIQLSMVPTVFPEHEAISIYGSLTPARAVGGDLYDFFIRDGKLVFCIGDVSGKGIPAALLMTVGRNLFRAYASDGSTPDSIVARMDKDLRRGNDACMFITFFVGILDLSSGLLRYCNAGHEAPILINKTVEPLPVDNGLPLGTFIDLPYQVQETVIAPQTTILLYTDGLNEAMNADFNEFGEDRIFDELNRAVQAGQLSPKEVVERMAQTVHTFVGDTEQSDDLTMLCIRLM